MNFASQAYLQAKALQLLRRACEIYREASYQGHSSHWDKTMQNGAGCPECIRARELREEADELVAQANDTFQGDYDE